MTLARSRPVPQLQRVLGSSLEQVAAFCRELRAFLLAHRLANVAFAVELVAREVLDNAVIHGNRSVADRKIEVQLWLRDSSVRLQVSDEGKGFPWRLQSHSSTDAVGPSGRGLPLCFENADRVHFNPCGNQVTLWIRTGSRKPRSIAGG